MPDLDLSRETTADAGSGQDAAQPSLADLAAGLQERQQQAVAGQHPWEQEQLAERLNRVVYALKDRVDPRQLDAFRQGQTDQLRERQDGSRQLCEAAQLAVAQLEQRQQLTDERPGQQRDVSRPSEQQQTGLVDLVNRMLSDLSKMQDQQNACLRQQRQDALAAAASGADGDLSRALDRQRADRAALHDQLSQIRQDLDRASRDLAGHADHQQQRTPDELRKQVSPETGVTARTQAAVERSVTEARRADAQDVYRTTANLAKGNFGERMAAHALARDGHQILYFKPSILGTNQGGIDICSYKDGLVYLIDNKAFTSQGNISSVSSLTTNLAKNIARAERDLAAMAADVTRPAAERQMIRQALTALQQDQYVRVVTNAALTKNADIKTGVTQALARQGIQFIDFFQVTGNRDDLRGHL